MFWVSTILRRPGLGCSCTVSLSQQLLYYCYNLLLVISLFLKTRNNIHVSGRVAMILHLTKTAPSVKPVINSSLVACHHQMSAGFTPCAFPITAPTRHPQMTLNFQYSTTSFFELSSSLPQQLQLTTELSLCYVLYLSGVKDTTNSPRVLRLLLLSE